MDPEVLLARTSVEALGSAAEEYFARLEDWEPQLAKPFNAPQETPELLSTFGALLYGLELFHGLTVLDFGAGTGWTSWMMSQLGCRVIVSDVAPTALQIARARYETWPPVGHVHAPRFLLFDGRRLELDDGSVDRIVCNDAFHHVPNPRQVIDEFARVLRPAGICMMAEPGPHHSRTPQSQVEMRNHHVVERDIIAEDIAADARSAGFANTEIGVFCGLPTFVDAQGFEHSIGSASPIPNDITRAFLENRRLILLRKAGTPSIDSRQRFGLGALLNVRGNGTTIHATITNTGQASWLQEPGEIGTVNLGAHLFSNDGTLIDYDFLRAPLAADAQPIAAGTTLEVSATLPQLASGTYRVEFDLVAEGVAWFADTGNRTVHIELSLPDG
jgi:2-polyprenyl-3-methyl-5-hydroxy-6-metoxy-1,4-benzoquinol methylase